MNEQHLVRDLKAKTERAFSDLVDSYQERVLNTCLGFVPNLQDAEDITQEVFLEIFRSIANFREEAQLSTWIYRIAVTKSLEFINYRKRKKRSAFFQSLIGLEDRQAIAVSDQFNHPGIQLEDKERAKVLYDQIARLPENQRTAFTLHKVEGISHKEIAEVMNTSVSSIESLLHRAKKNLQKYLATYYKKQMI